jgi:hypothetical protein
MLSFLYWGITPELTGAGGPIGPQGTNIGRENGEAMANVGVRVERFVRLGADASTACAADNLIRLPCCTDSLCYCFGLSRRPLGESLSM